MEEIIFRQRDAAKALTGKAFLLAVASVVLKLAIAQIIVNILIKATGVGLVSVAFYLYAIWLLVGFMRRTVASHVYTLKEQTLILERKLGDSTTTVVEIPIEAIVSVRPVSGAERLHQTYKQVTVIDPASKTPLRMKLAFAASLISAHAARALAGKAADRQMGHVAVYEESGRRKACVFRPNEEMCAALEGVLRERFGFDERMAGKRDDSLFGRALERAFPAHYAFVEPLVRPEDIERASEEIARQKAERDAAKKAAQEAAKARTEARKKEDEHRKAEKKDGKAKKPRKGKNKAGAADGQNQPEDKAQDDAQTGPQENAQSPRQEPAQQEQHAHRRPRNPQA